MRSAPRRGRRRFRTATFTAWPGGLQCGRPHEGAEGGGVDVGDIEGVILLQCGRPHEGAEGAERYAEKARADLLQCGRPHEGAEGRGRDVKLWRAKRSFNAVGPTKGPKEAGRCHAIGPIWQGASMRSAPRRGRRSTRCVLAVSECSASMRSAPRRGRRLREKLFGVGADAVASMRSAPRRDRRNPSLKGHPSHRDSFNAVGPTKGPKGGGRRRL